MINVMILVCTVGVQPADCQNDTAVDVIKGPAAENEIQCALYGQQLLASVAHLLDPHTYPKITCTRTAAADQQAGRPRAARPPRG